MATLTFQGETYTCARAQKGSNFVRLLDENGDIVFFADGVSDFSGYVLSGCSWENPIAVIAPTVGATPTVSNGVITLTIPESVTVETNLQINFVAPCDCTAAYGLAIRGKGYALVDALGNSIVGVGGFFSAGSVVSVVLNVETQKAHIQNPATTCVPEETAAVLGLPGTASVNDALRKMETNVQVEETMVQTKKAGTFWETGGVIPNNQGGTEDRLLLSVGDAVYSFTRQETNNSVRVSYDNGATWSIAGNSPYGMQGVYGAATNGEVGYVTAAGQSGMCYRLTLDGVNITYDSVYTYLPRTVTWFHAAYGNGVWVIFPYSGNYAARAVEAGRDTTFAEVSLPVTGSSWNCLRFVGDKFIALSNSEGCIYSTDGQNWYQCTGVTFTTPHSVAYKNGVYVIGTAGTEFYVSNDGITWRTAATATASDQGKYVATTNDAFVAIRNGNGKTYYSYDGDVWECNENAVLTGGSWINSPESVISHNGVVLASIPYNTGATCVATYDEYNYQYELMFPNGELNTEKVMSALGLPGTKIETGSYTGTGNSGSSYPCSLTFSFAPKMLFVYAAEPYSSTYHAGIHIEAFRCTTAYTSAVGGSITSCSAAFYAKVSNDGKTVTWYSDSGTQYQMNYAIKYTYYAIG